MSQSRSSEPSPQCGAPSQMCEGCTQRPLSHWNCPGEQRKGGHEAGSSLPSPQSSCVSQRHQNGMHLSARAHTKCADVQLGAHERPSGASTQCSGHAQRAPGAGVSRHSPEQFSAAHSADSSAGTTHVTRGPAGQARDSSGTYRARAAGARGGTRAGPWACARCAARCGSRTRRRSCYCCRCCCLLRRRAGRAACGADAGSSLRRASPSPTSTRGRPTRPERTRGAAAATACVLTRTTPVNTQTNK